MKCPECGKEMESGIVSSGNNGMFWSDRPIWSSISAERIPMMWKLMRLRHLSGYRCEPCKLMIMRYLEEERPQGYAADLKLTGSGR
jgi:hypothetical protein